MNVFERRLSKLWKTLVKVWGKTLGNPNLWICEVWKSIRPTFILLVKDAGLFLVLMVTLAVGHYVIAWLPSSHECREMLEVFHFYVIAAAWLFFVGMLFVELAVGFFKHIREQLQPTTDKPGEQTNAG